MAKKDALTEDTTTPAAEEAAPAAPIAYRYRGGGDFVPGIPARDLTTEDLANLPAAEIEASGLYERAQP